MAKNFELPSAGEKLSSKFIMDALRAKAEKRAELEETPLVEAVKANQLEFETCGTAGELEQEPPQVEVAAPDERGESYDGVTLPENKKYFRIGEVASLLKVEPHVLRYWESEFKKVKPSKTSSGQRVYSRKDVETLHYIKHLLHVERFSIKGARKKLSEQRQSKKASVGLSPAYWDNRNRTLRLAIQDLKEMIQLLRHD